jgi:hypothetical protein
MKRNHIQFLLTSAAFIAGITQSSGQSIITGHILNSKKEALPAASIGVERSAIGTTADTAGLFTLQLPQKGRFVLKASSVGYLTRTVNVEIADSLYIDIVLKEEPGSLGEVVVVGAGSFEASDKARGASLTPIDAVTVAGNGGDIANALRTLPGAQQIGEQQGLFVRGGTGEEAKQFVDGALLKQPNFSPVPGMPQYARLNPFLFKGILFSSGGYSALYGQAMSSALILESVDLPDKSSASFSLFPMMTSAGIQQLGKDRRSSYGVNARYGHSGFYNNMIDVRPDFFAGPEYVAGDANFRIKTSKTGMLKFYTNYGYSKVGMNTRDVDSSKLFSSFEVKGVNLYNNLSWRESLGNGWRMDAVLAYNYYRETINNGLLDENKLPVTLADYPYDQKNSYRKTASQFAQARLVLSKPIGGKQTLRMGAEYFYNNNRYTHNDTLDRLRDDLTAAFAEADIYLLRNVGAKIGVRAEYSSLLQEASVAPRISLAYRFPHAGQINMAYGVFYQEPEAQFLLQNKELSFSRATHYLINYQYKAGNRLLRIEGYYKKYNRLPLADGGVTNGGDGYARGVELFFRDKRSIKNFDYWITYTYLDTKRKFWNYPTDLRPSFATPHTASFVAKRFFADLNLSANLSYTIAKGRPYYDLQMDANGKSYVFDEGTTNTYSSLNLSFAYLFTMFKGWKNKDFSGIGFGMNNVFDRKHVFGYNYSYNGLNKLPVTLPADRTYYIGLFMSFGIDRRDDFINDNL